MKATLATLPFLLTIALVFYVERDALGFAVWNAAPVVTGLCLWWLRRRVRPATAWGFSVFAVSSLLLVGLLHLSWVFDWGDPKNSSTATLVFIFIPLWAFVLGTVLAIIAWAVRLLLGRRPVAR